MSNKSRKWKANQRKMNGFYIGKLTKEILIIVLKEGQTYDMKFISTMLSGEHYSGIDWVNYGEETIGYSYDNPNVDGDPDNGDYVIQSSISFDDAVGEINCIQNSYDCQRKLESGNNFSPCDYHKEKFKKEGYL